MDLFADEGDADPKREIDVLCVLDGIFHAVEAKRSASTFLNQSGRVDKFVRVIELLRPDVAVLAFERLCADSGDRDSIRSELGNAITTMRARLGPHVDLRVIIAEEIRGFDEFPSDLGWYGSRAVRYS